MSAITSSTRRIVAVVTRARSFHTTARALVKAGDLVPSTELFEGSPGNKVNLRDLLGNKALIIGVPAAFSPGCSNSHIPGYISHRSLKDAGNVFVVAVNDAFVMKAWQEVLDKEGKSGIRFLADPRGDFNRELDLLFDSSAIFGNDRSKRYALEVENGEVRRAHVEPDNTGISVSAAENVLG